MKNSFALYKKKKKNCVNKKTDQTYKFELLRYQTRFIKFWIFKFGSNRVLHRILINQIRFRMGIGSNLNLFWSVRRHHSPKLIHWCILKSNGPFITYGSTAPSTPGNHKRKNGKKYSNPFFYANPFYIQTWVLDEYCFMRNLIEKQKTIKQNTG